MSARWRRVDLPAADALRDFFLGDLLGLPQIAKGELLGNQLGSAFFDFLLARGFAVTGYLFVVASLCAPSP
jgi:hypothetical protein